MQRKIFWAACSLLLLSGCAQISRPDADLCVVNVPGKKLTCYNIKSDFNDDGQVKPTAQPHFKPAPTVDALNKFIVQSPDDFAKLKVYIKLLREEYQRGCKNP